MKSLKQKLFPYMLIAPSVIVILIVLIIPLGYAIYCSLYAAKYMSFDNFVGLDNYKKIFFEQKYLFSLLRTFLISAAALVLSLLPGIAFALWTHTKKGLYAYSIQLMVLIPWVTSQVVSTMLWKWLLNEDTGLLNYIIQSLGGERLAVFSNKRTAVIVLIVLMAWRTVGYAMINVLAGLKGIPASIEEAALIDGSTGWQRIIHIRLPMVKTQILISAVIISLSNLNNLVVPMALTGGGPGTATSVITMYIYRIGFQNFQFGLSSAMTMILFILTVALAIVYVKAVKYEI